MKKKILILSFAVLFLTGCSSGDTAGNITTDVEPESGTLLPTAIMDWYDTETYRDNISDKARYDLPLGQ